MIRSNSNIPPAIGMVVQYAPPLEIRGEWSDKYTIEVVNERSFGTLTKLTRGSLPSWNLGYYIIHYKKKTRLRFLS